MLKEGNIFHIKIQTITQSCSNYHKQILKIQKNFRNSITEEAQNNF